MFGENDRLTKDWDKRLGNETLWGRRALKSSELFLRFQKPICMPRVKCMLRKRLEKALGNHQTLYKQEVKAKAELQMPS